MFHRILVFVLAAISFSVAQAHHSVKADEVWARATVPGQRAGGVFMKLTPHDATRLVGGSSPAAASVEIHEMKLEGDVMRMRAIEGLDLPADRTVELSPGGYHLMLQGLKQPLKEGSLIPLKLKFRNAKGEELLLEVQVPVRGATARGAGHGGSGHGSRGHGH